MTTIYCEHKVVRLKRSDAERLATVLKSPEFQHWVRQVTVREELSGTTYVTFYTDQLTSLRVSDIDRISQQFEVTWTAAPSRRTEFILVRFQDR